MDKLFLLFLLLGCFWAKAQDSSLVPLPEKYLSKVAARVGGLEEKLDQKSQKVLQNFQKQEQRIYRKLAKVDSTKAAQYLASSQQQYAKLEQTLKGKTEFTQYLPFLDTLKTSLKFLGDHQELLAKAKDAQGQLSVTVSQVKELEAGLAKAETIKQFLKERRQLLKEQLGTLPFYKDLKKLNKQVYYYSAQVQEYKQILKDPKKIERRALELLSKTKAFQEFMRRNSQLASLFQLPGSDDADPSAALNGMQTRAQVNSLIQARITSGGPNAAAQVRDNMQAAQAQLSELKNRLSQYRTGDYGNTSSDIEQPDFKPNQQRVKSFFRRLEVGSNMQSQRAQYIYPATSDLGLSVGYRLNDHSVAGIGASGRVGWGSGFDHIQITYQGLGLRSFIDYKLKGSLYLSGGYEQNYRCEIRSINQLKEYSAWQSSGLLGLSKKFKASKKLKGEMKLLWDFLSYRKVPQGQAVLFRVGYTIK